MSSISEQQTETEQVCRERLSKNKN